MPVHLASVASKGCVLLLPQLLEAENHIQVFQDNQRKHVNIRVIFSGNQVTRSCTTMLIYSRYVFVAMSLLLVEHILVILNHY